MVSRNSRDWDDAFANMKHIEGSEKMPAFWAERAAKYRATMPEKGVTIKYDQPYGDHPRERFDLVLPEGRPNGLAVFVHGGYWMRLDKSHWTDLAEGARLNGWAVCIPSYTLAPEYKISAMTRQIGKVITKAAKMVSGPIHLSGHSAGGHLVSRMICADSPLPADVLARVAHTLSISGLHDLRPLLKTEMNRTLHLDMTEASAESAVLNLPTENAFLTCWVGGGELPEFTRQARIMAMVWEGLDAKTCFISDEKHNHFSVIEGLKEKDSRITATWCSVG